MKNAKIFFAAIMLFLPVQFSAQEPEQIIIGEKHTISSAVMGTEMEFWVHLPASYGKGTNRYPVLFVTDGDEHFFLASGITGFMGSQFLVPELIVVALFHDDRNHDLTPTHITADNDGFTSDAMKVSGGGEKLLMFLREELIPFVESEYRTEPYRIFAGHSLGGLLSVYAYLTAEDLFQAFIAMDPALYWDHHVCEHMLKELPANTNVTGNRLYVASAHNAPPGEPDNSPFRRSHESFFRELERRGVKNAKHDIFEDDNHLTVPLHSLYEGLSYVYGDYYIFSDPAFTEEVAFIREHYRRVSELYGVEFTAPEGLVEMIGKHFLLDRSDYAKAIEFFSFNASNYPNSAKAYAYLGRAYNASGNSEMAIESLRRALQLDPGNRDLLTLLEHVSRER